MKISYPHIDLQMERVALPFFHADLGSCHAMTQVSNALEGVLLGG